MSIILQHGNHMVVKPGRFVVGHRCANRHWRASLPNRHISIGAPSSFRACDRFNQWQNRVSKSSIMMPSLPSSSSFNSYISLFVLSSFTHHHIVTQHCQSSYPGISTGFTQDILHKLCTRLHIFGTHTENHHTHKHETIPFEQERPALNMRH